MITVNFGTDATNIFLDGVPEFNQFTIDASTAGAVNSIVQFDVGGNTFNFPMIKAGGTDILDGFTFAAGPAAPPGPIATDRFFIRNHLANARTPPGGIFTDGFESGDVFQ